MPTLPLETQVVSVLQTLAQTLAHFTVQVVHGHSLMHMSIVTYASLFEKMLHFLFWRQKETIGVMFATLDLYIKHWTRIVDAARRENVLDELRTQLLCPVHGDLFWIHALDFRGHAIHVDMHLSNGRSSCTCRGYYRAIPPRIAFIAAFSTALSMYTPHLDIDKIYYDAPFTRGRTKLPLAQLLKCAMGNLRAHKLEYHMAQIRFCAMIQWSLLTSTADLQHVHTRMVRAHAFFARLDQMRKDPRMHANSTCVLADARTKDHVENVSSNDDSIDCSNVLFVRECADVLCYGAEHGMDFDRKRKLSGDEPVFSERLYFHIPQVERSGIEETLAQIDARFTEPLPAK